MKEVAYNKKSIPFMLPVRCVTVGEVAKKMGVTVRALQYYDREGIFSPSHTSEGGRRFFDE